jgi:PAS domain S-box-containing protein
MPYVRNAVSVKIMFSFLRTNKNSGKPDKSLSNVLERLVGASETGNFDIRLNTNSLNQEDTEAVRLIDEALSNYKSATEYNLLKYRLTSDALGIALWDMDVVDGDPINPNNKIVFSYEFRLNLGFSGEYDFPNVLHSWSDRLHPEDKERTLNAFAAHLVDRTGKTPYDITYRLKLKNGEYRYFRALGTTLRNADGIPIRVAGALEDIDDKIQTQNQLAIMSSIVHNSPNFVSYKKLFGECLYVNPAATTMSGHSKEELLADYLGSLFDKEVADRLRGSIPTMLKEKGVLNYEIDVKRRDGTLGTFRVSSFLVGDDAYANIATDVTESKRIEAERVEALVKAEHANRIKSDFLAKMSHEIRTPISGVIGLSNLLLATNLDIKQSEFARLIKTSGQMLLFLIDDIFDFSKTATGGLELKLECFDIQEMIKSVISVLASRAEEKNIELCSLCEVGLPRRVTGDMGRVRQVLLHLTANAVKFTENGVISINIAVEEYRTNQIIVRFAVKDTGIGIPQDRLVHLFDAFYQVDDSSTRGFEGIGLGLPIAKKLVELMQGEIGVESIPDQGSTFWFRIPLDCNDRVIYCLQHSEHRCMKTGATSCEFNGHHFCFGTGHRRMNEGFQLTGKRALVTDDMELVCQFIGDQLGCWKMIPDTALSHSETFDKLVQAAKDQHPYSLLVIGLGSKEKKKKCYEEGLVLIRKIRETPEIKDTAIVLMQPLSAGLDQDFMEKFSVEYVRKPIFASELFDAVMNQLFHDAAIETEKHLLPILDSQRSDNSVIKNLNEPIHVLVAEDNRVNQIVIQSVLLKAGMTCEIVGNGRKAFDAVTARRFSAVLMDCQMPEMDGYEATIRIRQWEQEQNRPRIPIIALTANAVFGDEERCLEVGMDAYCNKPVDAKVVISTIEHWDKFFKEKGGNSCG